MGHQYLKFKNACVRTGCLMLPHARCICIVTASVDYPLLVCSIVIVDRIVFGLLNLL